MYKRIIIYGAVGSGKTSFAKKLSKKLGVRFYSTDDMVFDESQMKVLPRAKRDAALAAVSEKKSWIVEGTHKGDWTLPILKNVQLIIVLDYKKRVLYSRIVKRFKAGRKLGNAHGTLRSFLFLLWYAFWSNPKSYFSRKEFALKNKGAFIVVKNDKEANELLKQLFN